MALAAPRILVLGGTAFVGPALVDAALDRGAEVTVFNRGTRGVPDGVTALVGDRAAGDLAALDGTGDFDVVVDTWSGAPNAVADTVTRLNGRVGSYVYVSSCSVYTFPSADGSDETAPIVEGDPEAEDSNDYAQAKRGGELAAEGHVGPTVLARAGLVLGPRSNIGRLAWWLQRIARGGDVLAPGPSDLAIQYVDSRDLAAFCIDAGLSGLDGPFNVLGPPGQTSMADLLLACLEVTGSDARLRWVDPEVIEEAGIEPWTELPVWLPPGEMHGAMHGFDTRAARAAGLRSRLLSETVADTWAWLQEVGDPPVRPDLSHGLSAEKERAALTLAAHERDARLQYTTASPRRVACPPPRGAAAGTPTG